MNIALLHEKADPEWKSCAKITPNLVRALVRGYAEENSRSFHPSSESALTPGKFVDELVAFHPARIHFVDHRSNRLALLKELASRRWPGGRPILVFHVYGDFVLTAREWFAAQRALTKFKVSWICASDRQASLLRKLVREKRAVKSIPFPLDTLSFYSNRALRRLTRSRLNIGDREPMLLYVGRLSEQKNIGQLLNLMSYLDALGGPLPALYLAGEFDDMGVSYLKRAQHRFEYQYSIMRSLNELPADLQKRVRFLGSCDDREIRALCNAADLFVSMSVHNDEDFGMAPAEALACGCPCVLSDWGGYASFRPEKKYQSLVRFVPVSMDVRQIEPRFSSLLDQVTQGLGSEVSWSARAGLSRHFHERLAIHRIADRLQGAACASFQFAGFTHAFSQIARAQAAKKQPFLRGRSAYNALFQKLYGDYAG